MSRAGDWFRPPRATAAHFFETDIERSLCGGFFMRGARADIGDVQCARCKGRL